MTNYKLLIATPEDTLRNTMSALVSNRVHAVPVVDDRSVAKSTPVPAGEKGALLEASGPRQLRRNEVRTKRALMCFAVGGDGDVLLDGVDIPARRKLRQIIPVRFCKFDTLYCAADKPV